MWRCWGVVTWHCWAPAGLTSPPRIGPKKGAHRGARRQQWQPRVMVVVLDGGGGEKRDGTVTMCDASDVSTAKWVRSQPKHIPCGTTWIPYGFHMDSMWNRGAE
jgi:hypothetical protein